MLAVAYFGHMCHPNTPEGFTANFHRLALCKANVLRTDNLLRRTKDGFKQSELNTSNNKALQPGGR